MAPARLAVARAQQPEPLEPAASSSLAPEAAALIVHDLKNALGVLEAQLGALRERPDHRDAAVAHRQCAELRRRFVGFLTVYGSGAELRAHADDESPRDTLESLRHVERPDGAAAVEVGDCADAPLCWYFDHRLVRMALESALYNAWRFARRSVVVGARLESGCLVFTIDDDGPGVGRANGADTDAAAATGLGTALCRAVARAHGMAGRRDGGVVLRDRVEGGARFELWLP